MHRIVIIGAGISGLTAAYRSQCLMPSAEIIVLEAGDRPGGTVWTQRDAGFVVEHGPNGFLDNATSTLDLVRDIGLGGRLVAASEAARKHRYLYIDDRLQELPSGLGSLLTTPLLGLGGKLRMLAEPLVPCRGQGAAESVAAFARRRFGRQAAEVFIDALVTGIHGGDPELLDIRAAFPRLVKYEAEAHGIIRGVLRARKAKERQAKARGERPAPQRMWSFPGGLREIIDALTARLKTPPIYNAAVERLEQAAGGWTVHGAGQDRWQADAVVQACPAHAQAGILSPLDETLAHELAGISYNRIAVVALGYRSTDVPQPYGGFGFIAPQRTRQDLLGVQWCSAIYPDRAPVGMVLWRALCGGWNRAEVADWPEEKLIAGVAGVLRKVHGITVPPVYVKVIRWPQAIPQYMLSHPERVQRIEQRASRFAGLFLTGNSFRGVALNDCTADAAMTAERVAGYFTARIADQ